MFRSLIFAALLLTSILAAADTPYVKIEQRLTPEQLQATGLNTLSPEQLALLNSLLSEESAKSAAIEKARRQDEPNSGSTFIGLDDHPIKSRVKGTVTGWEPGTVFELENGQQWKVLKGSMKLRKPVTSPEILVVPGIAGRWFLQVDEDSPKARVYRID